MRMRKLLAVALSLVLLLSLAGCGSMVKENAAGGDYYYDRAESSDMLVEPEKGQSSETPLPENRKLIQKVWLNAETDDMDTLLSNITSRISQLGGYVEAKEIYNGSAYSGRRYRNAELTIRIPAEKMNTFVEQVGEVSNIVSSNQTMDDVTLSYVATESRIKALETEEARLLELLAKAENMNDLLTIEARLTDVRTELEQVKSTLRLYDNLVDYGTVYLNITEVKEYTVVTEPETVWQRIGAGWKEAFNDLGDFFVELFVFVVISLPYLLIITAVVVVIVVLIRRNKKKKKSEKTDKT